MYIVTVEFAIDPAQWEAFLPRMLANARQSRECEPGCRQFDVCVDAAKPDVVFLYEVYDDRAAFDAHLAAPHFLAFAEATRDMVKRRTILTWNRVAP
jgi:autoinducer 2-degrading protein